MFVSVFVLFSVFLFVSVFVFVTVYVFLDAAAYSSTYPGQSVSQSLIVSDFGDSYRIYRACSLIFVIFFMTYLRNESLQHILQGKPVSFGLLPIKDLSQPPEPGHCFVLRKWILTISKTISCSKTSQIFKTLTSLNYPKKLLFDLLIHSKNVKICGF